MLVYGRKVYGIWLREVVEVYSLAPALNSLAFPRQLKAGTHTIPGTPPKVLGSQWSKAMLEYRFGLEAVTRLSNKKKDSISYCCSLYRINGYE